jgi:hypothetical protein
MKYTTGTYALNLPSRLNTQGDWHADLLDWNQATWRESSESRFGDFGIEIDRALPNGQMAAVANHLRALLDLLELGYIQAASGMRRSYLGTNEYDNEFFAKVAQLDDSPYWKSIYRLMSHEYYLRWVRWYEQYRKST